MMWHIFSEQMNKKQGGKWRRLFPAFMAALMIFSWNKNACAQTEDVLVEKEYVAQGDTRIEIVSYFTYEGENVVVTEEIMYEVGTIIESSLYVSREKDGILYSGTLKLVRCVQRNDQIIATYRGTLYPQE